MQNPTPFTHPFENIRQRAEHSKCCGGCALLVCGKKRHAIASGDMLALFMATFTPMGLKRTQVRVFLD